MTRAHLAFCHPGTPFFDLGARDEDLPVFAALQRPVREGWQLTREPQWTHLVPRETELVAQGWKIHVSATLANCDRVLEAVMGYCYEHVLPFKVLPGPEHLRRRNAKDGDRTASGKFITIYPHDDATLERTLTELGDLLDGEEGPYILSDLRWRAGPLYVRYGAFITEIIEGEHGRPIHCIRDPEGNLVEDRRGVAFRPPSWAPVPGFLDEALQARQQGRLEGFNYRVHGAMHYSNGGGVYRASHAETGQPVLLKEARPLAGLDDTGRDAVARQETEIWALRQLDGLPSSARLLDHVRGHEHRFLVREFVEGESLVQAVTRKNPLVRGERDPGEKAAYAAWALDVLESVEQGVNDMHERGVVFGDLHPGNVLVREDGTVAFIDLETASPLDTAAPQVFAAPGYRAPASYRGEQTDRFALGCMRVAVLAPGATDGFLWDTGSVDEAIRFVREEFELSDEYEAAVRADLGALDKAVPEAAGRPPVPRFDEVTWPQVRGQIARWIIDSATPEREDRLYPGDIAQFARPGAGLGLMHGAAGVLVSLADAGQTPPEEHVDWLLGRLATGPVVSTGLHDGLAGIAYALERLGASDRARELAEATAARALDDLDQGLTSGLAGVGLSLAWFATRTGDSTFLDAATSVADRMLAAAPEPTPPGLLYGGSGRALCLLALYDATGDAQLLLAADEAVRTDLALFGHEVGGRPVPQDIEPVRRGAMAGPGALAGDGGVALALSELLRRREDAELAEAARRISRRSAGTLVPWPGLLRGRSGTLLVAAAGEPSPDLDRHVQGLRMNALAGSEGLAFFGDSLLRLSCDLGTGAAGVLAVLDRVLGSGGRPGPAPVHLFGTA
ncbi:class III lanthionine synthetase LanKC [Georgenia sp. MJ170]|uniref:class III lanthionine synthetase LanKC n=1 Tax=Georgenia sunbinii TaxID=3117728 RepID=UPI002F25F609